MIDLPLGFSTLREVNPILLLLATTVLYLIASSLRPRTPLPPGPRGLPIIGNMFDMPKEYEWLHWAKHKDLYGAHSESIHPIGLSPIHCLPSCEHENQARSAPSAS